MKPGDLVYLKDRIKEPIHWLYYGDQQCWDEFYSLVRGPINITFGANDIGVILMIKKMKLIQYSKSYVKLLTHHGIGWIFETYIKKIND